MPAASPLDRRRHQRRSIRLPDYDYSQSGAYFVTLCTQQREMLFGDIAAGEMRLNEYGEIVSMGWVDISQHYAHVTLDAFVIMPNHVHGIVVIENDDDVGAIHESPLHESPLHELPLPDARERRTMLLPKIVGYFKMNTAKRINAVRNTPGIPVWQRNYYEHIIRHDRELNAVRAYILNNPLNWARDPDRP